MNFSESQKCIAYYLDTSTALVERWEEWASGAVFVVWVDFRTKKRFGRLVSGRCLQPLSVQAGWKLAAKGRFIRNTNLGGLSRDQVRPAVAPAAPKVPALFPFNASAALASRQAPTFVRVGGRIASID